jgi:cytochrome c-type biogenesis protein
VFTVAGLLLAAGLRLIIRAVPWAAAAVGAGLVVLGVLLLAGRKIGIAVNGNGLAGDGKGARGLVAFGAAYALASLSCTVAVLSAVVGQALAAADVVAVLAVFAAYAAGSASVLVLLTVSAALASGALTRVVRRALPCAGRLSGAFLVLSGLYLIAYWVPQLAGQREGTSLSRGGGALAGSATQWLQGNTTVIAVAAATVVVVVAALVTAAALRSRPRSGPPDDGCCPPAPARTGSAGTRTD